METKVAVKALQALAHETRLQIFRHLVREAPDGSPAGTLAVALELPASTLSFHLQHLVGAGLIQCERRGRTLIYALRPESLNQLVWFLGEDCCQGRKELCSPPTARIDARAIDARKQTDRPTVLFLCSQNSARSQMAEAILRDRAGDRFEVRSCGIKPQGVHPLTLQVLCEAGIDDSGLEAKDLGQLLGKIPIHYAVTVCDAAQEQSTRIHPFAENSLYWPFPDPAIAVGSEAEQVEVFRTVRDLISARIEAWLQSEAPRQASERRTS